ncbi:MAG: hypothetical protein HQK76_16820 [Desulfobacterales bacterium]|nr:hypothetical protein [Desulfobacterales bacterium]
MPYYLICPISHEIGSQSLNLIEIVRTHPVKGLHNDIIHDGLLDVADAAMEFYFMDSMEILNANAFFKKLVRIGISTAHGIISSISNKLIKQLEPDQLLDVADWAENIVRPMSEKINVAKELKATYVLACPLSNEIATEMKELIRIIQHDPRKGIYAEKIHDTVLSFSSVAMNYYYLGMADILKLGSFGRKLIAAGIKTAEGLLSSLSRRIFKNLDSGQLLKLTDWTEKMVLLIKD